VGADTLDRVQKSFLVVSLKLDFRGDGTSSTCVSLSRSFSSAIQLHEFHFRRADQPWDSAPATRFFLPFPKSVMYRHFFPRFQAFEAGTANESVVFFFPPPGRRQSGRADWNEPATQNIIQPRHSGFSTAPQSTLLPRMVHDPDARFLIDCHRTRNTTLLAVGGYGK